MLSGLDGNERPWTVRRLPEEKRWGADAVVPVRGSPSGAEFEQKITARNRGGLAGRTTPVQANTGDAVLGGTKTSRSTGAHQDARGARRHMMNRAGQE